MTDTNKEREAFEAMHLATYAQHIARHGGSYKNAHVRCRWEGWQARASLAASAGSEPVAPVDRSDAVNLARNMLEVYECKGITPRGVETLCNAVLAMDAVLLAHPSPPEGMAGWKPIATAPKDGTLILVHFKSKGVRAVSWDSPFHDEVTEENGIWCVDDDKHGPYGLRGYNDDGPTAPTHWMPLPAPPASEAKGASQ